MTTRSNQWRNAVCLLLFPVLLFVLLWLLGHCGGKVQDNVVADTTRVLVVDTVTVRFPQAVDSVVVRYETVRLPLLRRDAEAVAVASCPSGETVPVDSVVGMDSATVEIPITQKEYGDSTWHAWVSGYCVQLDSIRVYPRREVVTVTQTVTRCVPKRWGVGIQVGYGWVQHAGWQPYLGVGLHWNISRY